MDNPATATATRRGLTAGAREWLRATSRGLVTLALLIGVGAGLGAVGFRYLIEAFTLAFTGHHDYSRSGHAGYGAGGALGPWFVIGVPVVGGLLYGPLIERFASEARGHGVPEVMLAVAERGGRIRPQVAAIKSLASALCIGAGGSVGREGPIVQIGSALGSALGQVARVPDSRLRILVACGAAAGISATFNAPIAGVFFGLELILRDFEADSFGVVVLSSFVADIIGRSVFGAHPFLALPAFAVGSIATYPLYIGLGLLAAVVGAGFTRVLYGAEDIADRLWRGPEWLRPAAGGVLVGLLLFALPELYGVGYPPLEHAIRGGYVVWFLLLLLAGKVLATSLTIAIGGSGGVFAPSLFMGAMLGSAYGATLHAVVPGLVPQVGVYGLVGMGAVFAGATRAPITAVIIIFELTGEYRIILPLMFAIVLAVGFSRALSRDTIYTLKLRRRGIDVMRGRGANLMQLIRVADAMQELPHRVSTDMPASEVVDQFAASSAGRDGLPVVDEEGRYVGTIGPTQLEEALRDGVLDATVGELAQNLPALTGPQTLEQAMTQLLRARSGLPVVDPGTGLPVGWLTHLDVLQAYNERLQQSADDPRRRPLRTSARPGLLRRSLIQRLRGYRIVELGLASGGPPVGSRIDDLDWPAGTRLVTLCRDDEAFEPSGEERLQKGDSLTVLVPAGLAETLVDRISAAPHRRGG